MTPAEESALAYCLAYDEFHTLVALHRLTGWTGQLEESPPEVKAAHDEMVAKVHELRVFMMLQPNPSYTERAKERLRDA